MKTILIVEDEPAQQLLYETEFQEMGFRTVIARDGEEAIDKVREAHPDVVILDPPRAGIHRRVIASLLEVLPRRIVYVSCNPTTQARDCGLLSEHYRIAVIQPVDMFPHTYHIESVVLLERKESKGTEGGNGTGEADTQNH